MARVKHLSTDSSMTRQMRDLVEFSEKRIAAAITESNVMQTKLSHDKSILGDEHITGWVGGKARRIKKGETEKKGRAKKSLGVPISRKGRPVSLTGHTTFHLRNTPVRASCIDSGKLGTAGHHDKYLNREGAVPVLPYKPAISAVGQGNYIERDGATEAIDGKPVIISNISDDPAIREDFHSKMEKVERTACGKTREKKIQLYVHRNKEFFQKLVDDPNLPLGVRNAIIIKLAPKQPVNAEPLKLSPSSNDEKVDWVTVEPHDVNKVYKCLQRLDWKKNNKKWSAIACFDQGSSPQVYQRIEGELPIGLSLQNRVAALKKICRIFERERLPYIAALHAPDELNDPDNVHFHILYYSRPAALMTQDREKHFDPYFQHASKVLSKKIDFIAPKIERRMELRQKAWPYGKPLPEQYEGKWDFEIEYRYKTGKRSYKTAYPFRQIKSRRVVSKEWFADLRNHVAKSINEELINAGLKPKFHPGSFKDLKIEKTPETKLFKDQADREFRGIPTVVGIENERSDWDYRTSELDRIRKTQQQLVINRSRIFLDKFNFVEGRASSSITAFKNTLAEYKAQREIAIQAAYESRLAEQVIERLRSRPSTIVRRNIPISRSAEMEITALGTTPTKKLATAHSRKLKAEHAINEALAYEGGLFNELGEAITLPYERLEDAKNAKRRAHSALQELRGMLKKEPELEVLVMSEPEPQPEPAPEPKSEPEPETIRAASEPAPPATAISEPNLRPPSPIVRNTRAKPSTDARVDAFACELLSGKRRLQSNSSGQIVPVTFYSPAESLLANDIIFRDLQLELQKIKTDQDKRVADVIEYLKAAPDGLQLYKRNAEPISRRYQLKVNMPSYRKDFLQFGDDPEIIAAVKSAIQINRQKALDKDRRDEEFWAEKSNKIARWQAQKTAERQAETTPVPESLSPTVNPPKDPSKAILAGSATSRPQTSAQDDNKSRKQTLHPVEKQNQLRRLKNKTSSSSANARDPAEGSTKTARDIEMPWGQISKTSGDRMPSAEFAKRAEGGQEQEGRDKGHGHTHVGDANKTDVKPDLEPRRLVAQVDIELEKSRNLAMSSESQNSDIEVLPSKTLNSGEIKQASAELPNITRGSDSAKANDSGNPSNQADEANRTEGITALNSAPSRSKGQLGRTRTEGIFARLDQYETKTSGSIAPSETKIGRRDDNVKSQDSSVGGPAMKSTLKANPDEAFGPTDPLKGKPFKLKPEETKAPTPAKSSAGRASVVTYEKVQQKRAPVSSSGFQVSNKIAEAIKAANAAAPTSPTGRNLHPKIDEWLNAAGQNDDNKRRILAAKIETDKNAKKLVDQLDANTRASIKSDWDYNLKKRMRNYSLINGRGMGY